MTFYSFLVCRRFPGEQSIRELLELVTHTQQRSSGCGGPTRVPCCAPAKNAIGADGVLLESVPAAEMEKTVRTLLVRLGQLVSKL